MTGAIIRLAMIDVALVAEDGGERECHEQGCSSKGTHCLWGKKPDSSLADARSE